MATVPVVVADVVQVNRSLAIPAAELSWHFSGSGGPGGQHVNTANTRVELRFDVEASPSLNPRQRERLLACFGPVVRVVVSDERSQARNRDLAVARFSERLAAAMRVSRPRHPTRPTASSVERRIGKKRRRSQRKADRATDRHPDDD